MLQPRMSPGFLASALAAGAAVFVLHGWLQEALASWLVSLLAGLCAVALLVAGRLAAAGGAETEHVPEQEQAVMPKLQHPVIDEVAGELRQVHGFNQVVRGHLQHVIDETGRAAVDLIGHLHAIDAALSRIETQLPGTAEAEVLDAVRDGSRTLSAMLLDAQAAIQFQDPCRQEIEQVIGALHLLDEHAGMLARRLEQRDGPECVFTPIAEHLETLYSRYVMEGQRVRHDTTLQRGRPAAGAGSSNSVELF